MSKAQLLYEKIMKWMYIFGGIFFFGFLIDLFAAITMNAFDCTTTSICVIRDEFIFARISLYFLGIGTIIFIVLGRIFFGFAHKQSELLSAYDYRKSLNIEAKSENEFTRESLNEAFRSKDETQDSALKQFMSKRKEEKEKKKQEREEKRIAREKLLEVRKQEEEKQRIALENLRVQEEKKRKGKLNKTELILLLAKETGLSQNECRKFINAFTDAIKENVSNEDVKISGFGKFVKVTAEEVVIDEETKEETVVPAENTVDFIAYKQLLDKLNEELEIEEAEIEEVIEEAMQEEVVEEIKEEVVEETAQEKVVEEKIDDFDDLKAIPNDESGESEEEELEELSESVEQPQEMKKDVQAASQETKVDAPVEDPKEEQEVEKTVEETPVVEEVVEKQKEQPVEVVTLDAEKEELKEETAKVVKKEEPVVVPVAPKVEKKRTPKKKIVSKSKKDFIALMDETTDLSKNKANKFLKYFAEVVKEQLINRENVELEGIGFFTTIEMPAKEAVNPQTGDKIIVPAHHQVRLRFDEDLKAKMNEKN